MAIVFVAVDVVVAAEATTHHFQQKLLFYFFWKRQQTIVDWKTSLKSQTSKGQSRLFLEDLVVKALAVKTIAIY